MRFSNSGIKTIRETLLLQIKNKELDNVKFNKASMISLRQYDHLRSLLLLLSFL